MYSILSFDLSQIACSEELFWERAAIFDRSEGFSRPNVPAYTVANEDDSWEQHLESVKLSLIRFAGLIEFGKQSKIEIAVEVVLEVEDFEDHMNCRFDNSFLRILEQDAIELRFKFVR